MTITLQRSNSLRNQLTKTFETVKTITTSYPYEPLDDLNGFIIIDYIHDSFNFVTFEGKTYFVESKERLEGRNYKINLHIDVLTTYNEDILGAFLLPDRGGQSYNSYLYDNQQKGQVDYDTFSIPFAESITYGRIIFACIGGD